MKKFFPVSKPFIDNDDFKSVKSAMKLGWVSSGGPIIKKFEKKFSKISDKNYCVTATSGSAALDVAVRSLDLKYNGEVILPDFTIVSNLNCILNNNLKPVFVDCDKKTWNMKIEDINKKLTNKTVAIMAVHIYGFPCEIDKIKKICNQRKILLIEDAAEMLGHTFKGKKCGSFGDVSIFSFYANKHMTTGEGGMICTNSKKIYENCTKFKNLYFGEKERFKHDEMGWNYRMTSLQAALGLSQIKKIKKNITKKIEIGETYYKYLKDNENIYIQPPKQNNLINCYWVVGILILKKKHKSLLKKFLYSKGIETRDFFYPMHKQPFLKKYFIMKKNYFPNSVFLSNNGLYLPSFYTLKKDEIKFISKTINSFFYKN